MIWDTGQRDRVVTFASAGQSKPADLRTRFSVFVEGLVKITHTEKQYRVGIFFLKMMKLLHRGR